MALKTLNSVDITWKAGKGSTTLPRIGARRFPVEGFYIRSARTQEKRLFLPNNETAENLDGEAYDFFNPGGGGVEVRIYAD